MALAIGSENMTVFVPGLVLLTTVPTTWPPLGAWVMTSISLPLPISLMLRNRVVFLTLAFPVRTIALLLVFVVWVVLTTALARFRPVTISSSLQWALPKASLLPNASGRRRARNTSVSSLLTSSSGIANVTLAFGMLTCTPWCRLAWMVPYALLAIIVSSIVPLAPLRFSAVSALCIVALSFIACRPILMLCRRHSRKKVLAEWWLATAITKNNESTLCFFHSLTTLLLSSLVKVVFTVVGRSCWVPWACSRVIRFTSRIATSGATVITVIMLKVLAMTPLFMVM